VNQYFIIFAIHTNYLSVKNKIFRFLLLVVSISGLASCSTDLDITGEKKEVLVAYGILDASTKTQYIKINRAFLGDGNALEYSMIPDSTLYPYLLDVTLDIIKDGTVIKHYVADTVNIYKESDNFFTGYHPYYRLILDDYTTNPFSGDTVWLNTDYTYRLTIVDPVTGNIYESEAPGMSKLSLTTPNPSAISLSFYTESIGNIKFNSTLNGKLYEAKFLFHYYEVFDSNPSDTIEHVMEWTLGSVVSESILGNEALVIKYNNWDFYYQLQKKLEVRDDVTRFPGYMDVIVTVGAEDLNTYIDVNQPSNSIIQEKPTFSNITNGIGLFTSKYTYRRSKYKINSQTVQLLINGEYTNDLNFQDYWPNFPLH